MAAILGLEDAVVEELCAEIEGVWPANYNCPGQLVVSGENAAVDQLLEAAAARGARRTVKLPISGAFHSPLVAGAAERLAPALEAVDLERALPALHVDGDRGARAGRADPGRPPRAADGAGAVHPGDR